ncbi:MAG TPA: zf-HC2 domain-containing protein [Myxococcota bacterium]|nr:zf-HC2 domain-containing protein [Myxococcota bacterium]
MDEHFQEILLGRYLDNELPRRKKVRVAAHLSECSSCRGALEKLELQSRILRETLKEAAEQADFSRFDEKVLAGIAADVRQPLSVRARIWFGEALYHYRAIWLTSLVTAAVLLVLLLPLLQPAPVLRSAAEDDRVARVDNEAIIDSMEYAGQRSMIFTVSRNNTTVIWLYDFDGARDKAPEGDDL